MSTERANPWTRRAIAALLLLPFVATFSGGGMCFYVYCYDDDDDFDDDFDDDDDDCDDDFDDDDLESTAAMAGDPAASLRLTRFRYALNSEPGAHPMGRLEDIRGIGLPGRRTQAFEAPDFAEFAACVYEANRALIGLPEADGELLLEAVVFGQESIEVRWLQVARDPAPAGRAPGRLVFRFDLVGRLRGIENRTWLG